MIRKVFSLLLILISLVNTASGGSEFDIPRSFTSSGLLIHDIHVSQNQAITQPVHSSETLGCTNEINSDDGCHSQDEEEPLQDCHHCHCTHFDSIQTGASDFSLGQSIESHHLSIHRLYLDELISSIIEPPESHLALLSLPIV